MMGTTAAKQHDATALSMEQLGELYEHVRKNNTTSAAMAKLHTPRIRQIIPYVDVLNGTIYKVEMKHGARSSIKNFEVRFTPPGMPLLDHIKEWLATPLIRRDALPPKAPKVMTPRAANRMHPKVGTPEDPFYNPMSDGVL